MSYLTSLVHYYDMYADSAGVYDLNGNVLMPICHTFVQANYTVEIDLHGQFLRGNVVPKDDNKSEKTDNPDAQSTIVPVTVKSAVRSGNPDAYPLNEMLSYICTPSNGERMPEWVSKEKHENYIDLLKTWCEGSDLPDLHAVLTYVQNGTILNDVSGFAGVEPEKVKDGWVRFRIYKTDGSPERTWHNKQLFDDWIRFYSDYIRGHMDKQGAAQDLDYITGNTGVSVVNIPRGIRGVKDRTALISANDKKGYTFRGRFGKGCEAAAFGLESTQKAIHALQYLNQNGIYNGDEQIAIWSENGSKVPSPMESSDDLFGDHLEEKKTDRLDVFAETLKHAIIGNRPIQNPEEPVYILGVTSASPGQTNGTLALSTWAQLSYRQLIRNVVQWHTDTAWRIYNHIRSPRLDQIIDVAHGIYDDKSSHIVITSDKVKYRDRHRLIAIMMQGQAVPYDVVRACVTNASRPMSYPPKVYTDQVLPVVCGLIKKWMKDENKKEVSIMLDENCVDRSYLFGRLMAVYDKIEIEGQKKSVGKQSDSSEYHQTAVRQAWQACVTAPARTISQLAAKVIVYQNRLDIGLQSYYEKTLEDIMNKMSVDDYINKPLDSLYLIGYAHQMSKMYEKRKTKQTADNDKEQDKN